MFHRSTHIRMHAAAAAAVVVQVLTECRVFKTDLELDIMRYACRVASAAHVALMRVRLPACMPACLPAC